jgi:hypothetical protein
MRNLMPKSSSMTWGELSESSKKHYTSEGITAQSFNRWHRLGQLERTALTKQAQAAGYESGLKFTAIQTQVKKQTGKTITPATPPNVAAQSIVRGSKRKTVEGRYQYRIAANLFNMTEWDHLQWTDFMSP